MSRTIPFDTKENCDVCGIRGAYDFYGDFLCEKCCREDIEREPYEDELNDEFYCPCTECKCGAKEFKD